MLEVRDVYKNYNRTEVLKDINLTVMPGQIHGLIGENSAGKTTLIKCLTGIYRVNAGTVLYDGKPVYDNPEVKERIGYVADQNDYIGYYKVADMVHFYENFYDSFQKEQFYAWNEVFRVPVGKRIFALSKGQKMRLAFMLETAKRPDYLILDEPTVGMDPVARNRFLEFLVDEVEQREIGVLISSHNLDSLEKICDTVTLLHEGAVERQMAMDDMKGELSKLNVVFEGGAPASVYEMSKIVKIQNVGSIYTMLVKDYNEEFANRLQKKGASLIEAVDIPLEELFIALEESRGGE